MTEESPQAAASENPQFSILRIYLKDVSFEAPNSPAVFVQQFEPQVNVEIANQAKKLDENLYEVVLQISVAAKSEDKTGFLVELEQAGIFHMQGYDDEGLQHVLEIDCPRNLFPFAREAISDLVVKGGFPQLLLAPVNFQVLRERRLAARDKQAVAE
jgi:preprotein translocase subunit SecB